MEHARSDSPSPKPTVNEGERLRLLIEERGKTPADFARAAGVSRTAVGRYLDSEVIGKNAWPTVRAGLVKMGIDVRRLRAEDRIVDADTDLRPMVVGFDRAGLEKLRAILESDGSSRDKLIYYIDGILLTMPSKK